MKKILKFKLTSFI